MKFIPFLILFIAGFLNVSAQNSFTIKGAVSDTLDNPLILATVLLLEKSDSTMVDYTRSEMDGSFKIKNVEPGNYLIKTTYVGYLPKTVNASITDKNRDLGIIEMSEIATELMEIVVKEAKAAMKMRGDTIEYDASTFQVPEGSTVEDLLRRLPGIELEQDGTISADGKNVSKVTVDGKSFFGSDPKAATKNLPAEGISKVQVFDRKTEEEEATGLSTSSEDKTMNLELKEEFKKGGFGKILAGVGTESRAELKGNYNKFNKKIQFSVVGVGNNTGRNGLSWNDYRDFMGSQSFNFDFGTDYGFGGGNYYRNFTFGGSSSIESSIQSIFFSGEGGGGFPISYNGGMNFNYDYEKIKMTAVYYYNQTGLKKSSQSYQQKFFSDYTLNGNTISNSDNGTKGHRAEFEINYKIDSMHSLKLSVNGAVIDEDNIFESQDSTTISENNLLRNKSNFRNDKNRSGFLGRSVLVFNKKFKRKGRRFGANASYLITQLDDDIEQNSSSNFYDNSEILDSTSVINQLTTNLADKKQFKANAVYVEPLSKKFFSQTFYNFSNRLETGNRVVEDVDGNEKAYNPFLTRDYENTINLNRVGTAIRYSHDGINISIGAAYQLFDLKGLYSVGFGNNEQSSIDRQYKNFIPHFSAEITPNRNFQISSGYNRSANEPSIDDLQPIVDNSNPFYIREGNSALIPQLDNNFNLSIRKSWPLPGIRVRLSGDYSIYENQFSTKETIDKNLISYVQPINVDGGTGSSASASINLPIIKNKITVRTNAWYRYRNRPSLVNSVENNTKTNSITPSMRLSVTPNPNIALYINARYSFSDTKYDINTTQNQKIRSDNYNVEFNAKTLLGIYLNSNFEYFIYTNKRFDFNESVPILNVSLYKQFLKKKSLETRISVYDAFNKNTAISQNAFGNSVTRSQTDALGRYFMLSLTYNIQGLKDGVQKSGWW